MYEQKWIEEREKHVCVYEDDNENENEQKNNVYFFGQGVGGWS